MPDNEIPTDIQSEFDSLRDENSRLEDELARLRSLLDHLPLGVYQVTPEGEVMLANAAAREILERCPSIEMPPLSGRDATIEDGGHPAQRAADERGLDHETHWRDLNGNTFHIRQSVNVQQDPDGTPRYYECTLEDITERRRAEAALRASEERYRMVVEHSPAGILLVDDNFRVLYANGEACHILGRPPGDVMGHPFTGFLHTDSTEVTVERYLRRQEGALVPPRYEISIVRPDNTRRLIDLSAATFRTSNGAARTVAQLLDITDRTRAEQALRHYAETLEVRNAELDAFADSVAHDLKNPLSTIIGFAEALLDALDQLQEDEVEQVLTRISGMGRKMNSIIDELLLFARIRQTAVQPNPINMRITVENVLDRLAHMREEHCAKIEVPSHWPVALGYGPWIEEVWANYISNALTYGGKPPVVRLGSNLTTSGQIRFWVRDNGDGIAPSQQEGLFDSVADRARKAGGHGLGLSIVKRIVGKLGGEVAVESSGRPGEGCCFSFTLPAATLAVSSEPK